jgi:hypothetical protein
MYMTFWNGSTPILVAIPTDRKQSQFPKRRVHQVGHTSDNEHCSIQQAISKTIWASVYFVFDYISQINRLRHLAKA